MSRDYAKSKKKKPARTAPRAKTQSNVGNGLKLYFAGVLTGVFISFLAYLTTVQPTKAPELPQSTGEQEQAPKPRFDFYTLLPAQTMDVEVPDVEPARDLGGPTSTTNKAQQYVLQAGSFRQREDADRRRAELLLLGLEPSIQESTGGNGRWFRVYLGPYASNSAMNRARALTAGQDIDTLLLKRKSP